MPNRTGTNYSQFHPVKTMKKIFDLFDKTMDIMTFLAGGILIFIMLSVGLEVIARTFLDRPQMWVTEITECMLLYITFLASAWLLREEGHVKVDIILSRLGSKTKAFLDIISSVLGMFVSIVLTVYGFQVAWDCYQRHLYTPTAMEIPVAAIIIIIPIGSLMLSLQFLRRTGEFISGFIIEIGKSRP